MDIQVLKEKIIENDYIAVILQELGCHHISRKTAYYQCANPDGDNNTAITVYINDYITTIDYTRTIGKNSTNDIFDLIQFFKDCSFFKAISYVCKWCDIDYYADDYEELPDSLKYTQLMIEMRQNDSDYEEQKPIKPIPETILGYYKNYVNDLFANDNISYQTQRDFEIGYDESTNRITIPIRDEFGTLVGIKGRLFKDNTQITNDEKTYKYIYIEPCNRAKILYGLCLSESEIKRKDFVYVVEAEKGVMQLWDMGIFNTVATSGKKVSQCQIEKLSRICSKIIFCFDKDVQRNELKELADKFVDCIEIDALIDTDNILNEKESPTDDPEKFKLLTEKYCERIR